MIDALLVATMISTLAPSIAPDLRDRYAADIVAAVGDDEHPVEFAAALVATAKAEGEFYPRWERCEYRGAEGDNGRAVSLYQLHVQHWQNHRREEICADNRLATRLAADLLLQLKRRFGSWHSAFRAYVGVHTETDPNLKNRGHNFDRLVANARKAGAS